MEKSYRIVFEELTNPREVFERGILNRGVTIEQIDQMLTWAPVVLKSGLTLKEARLFAEVFQTAGAKVHIQESGLLQESQTEKQKPTWEIRALQDFIQCPQCGHKQLDAQTCQRCGFEFKGH